MKLISKSSDIFSTIVEKMNFNMLNSPVKTFGYDFGSITGLQVTIFGGYVGKAASLNGFVKVSDTLLVMKDNTINVVYLDHSDDTIKVAEEGMHPTTGLTFLWRITAAAGSIDTAQMEDMRSQIAY